MSGLDVTVAERVLELAHGRQGSYSADGFSAEKLAAKRRAAELIQTHGFTGPALDVGGEPFYVEAFADRGIELVQRNLPDGDMHALRDDGRWAGVVAMHVLEHSPFPLYVLTLIHRALTPGGWLYVAVPKPRRKWLHHAAHFTVLAGPAWRRLLADAGFEVVHHERGKFGPVSREERFLCRRTADA